MLSKKCFVYAMPPKIEEILRKKYDSLSPRLIHQIFNKTMMTITFQLSQLAQKRLLQEGM